MLEGANQKALLMYCIPEPHNIIVNLFFPHLFLSFVSFCYIEMLRDYFHDSFLLPLQVFQCWHKITGSIWNGSPRFARSRWEIAAYFERLAMHSLPASQLHFRWVIVNRPTSELEITLIYCRCGLFFSVAEVQCLNDTQKYLRRIVHEIGLELRSTAVCKGVRRTRDGPFTLKDALVHQQWTAADIMQAVRQYHASKKRKKSPPTKINHTSTAVKHQEEHEICNETPAVIWTIHQLHLIAAQGIIRFHTVA